MMTANLKRRKTVSPLLLTMLASAFLVSSCGGPQRVSRPAPVITPPSDQKPIITRTTPLPHTPIESLSDTESEVQIFTPKAEIDDSPAEALISNGRYLDAALLLAELAASLPAPQRQDYQLRVTTLLLQGNYILQADQILNQINIENLDQEFNIRKTLLSAQLALAKQQAPMSIANLDALSSIISETSEEHQIDFLRTRIDAYTMIGNAVEAAKARSNLDLQLSDPEEKLENQETLLRDLQKLPSQRLSTLIQQTADDTLRGWLSLAYIAVNAQNHEQAEDFINQWHDQFSSHPVQNSIINTIVAQQPEALGRPLQIAIALPTKGVFSKAADAIKNGFLAAYYSHSTDPYRPTLKFYDEGKKPEDIQAIYEKAVEDGANFFVGPLNKQSVTYLAQNTPLQIPVLSLNYADLQLNVPKSFFQMSLSPEQEAIHVAEHAWLDGHTNSAAIFPDTAWGSRVYKAFKARWEELGGSIVEYRTYNTKKNDYAVPIKQLLNIDESESRYRSLRKLVKSKIDYEPRRRKDVDFIFMAAFSRQGRLLRPQLKFHRASDIPVYATSHVYSGLTKPEMDRDMNGVKFSDMPWTLKASAKNDPLKSEISKIWPNDANRYMRLYALGIDAFQIIPELNRLRRNQFSSFQGETGVLYLDIMNRLQRRLLWAQFRRGIPKVLTEF